VRSRWLLRWFPTHVSTFTAPVARRACSGSAAYAATGAHRTELNRVNQEALIGVRFRSNTAIQDWYLRENQFAAVFDGPSIGDPRSPSHPSE
jgi:hypothetical protein